ncbi:uncharacterized protein LOC143248439 [Tachypleus tridentatus]|uniref:uncharacterized protein LOC143248439 n=1 Tax=Tachypleus tridentatus TaxID=6853 RepID=UPI003FD4E973
MKIVKSFHVFLFLSCAILFMEFQQARGTVVRALGLKLLLRLKNALFIPIPIPIITGTSEYHSTLFSSYNSHSFEDYSHNPWNIYESNELWNNNYGSSQYWGSD